MPTETSKVGPRADEQMSCSSAHLLTLKTSSIRSDVIRHPLKPASIRSDTIRHPPYYGLFEAYLRLIYVTTSLPLRNVRDSFINNPEGGDGGPV